MAAAGRQDLLAVTVPHPCTVLIAAPALMPVLAERTATEGSELLAFPDSDALRALDVITKRRPAIVALDRGFAASPRGAALINRIKADPSLIQSEIRVVSHDSSDARVVSSPDGARASGIASIRPGQPDMGELAIQSPLGLAS